MSCRWLAIAPRFIVETARHDELGTYVFIESLDGVQDFIQVSESIRSVRISWHSYWATPTVIRGVVRAHFRHFRPFLGRWQEKIHHALNDARYAPARHIVQLVHG